MILNTSESDRNEFVKPDSYTSVLIITINPQFKLYLDSNNKVLAVETLNKDAEKIKDLITFESESVEQVIQKVITVANEKGYIKDAATINFELAETTNLDVNNKLMDKAISAANEIISDLDIKVNIKAEGLTNIEIETEEPTTEEPTTEEPTTEEPTTEAPIIDEAPVIDVFKEKKSFVNLNEYRYNGKYNENNEENWSSWWEYGYNENGNLVKNIEHLSNGTVSEYSYEYTWEYKYDENGNLINAVQYKDDGNKNNEYFYDGKGNRIKHIGYKSDGSTNVEESILEYDKYGRVIKSLSRMSGKTYVGPWTTWLMEYDKYNNLIKRTSYDENGKCKNIEGFGYIYAKGWDEYWMSTVYYYNSEGEITHHVDYQYEFDENGYIVKQIQTYGTYEYI